MRGHSKGDRVGPYFASPKRTGPYSRQNEWIRDGRLEARMTQDELQTVSGVSKRSIIRFEQGAYCSKRMARALREGLASKK